jgi:hypothetical protein
MKFCLKVETSLTLTLLIWRIEWAPNSIPVDAKLHSLYISENYSTCFGWYFHPSSGAHTTVSTASGICHTVTAIYRYREKVGTGLSGLRVAYATHNTAAHSSKGVTNTRCCRYSYMRAWWWVEVPPETCRAVSRYKQTA